MPEPSPSPHPVAGVQACAEGEARARPAAAALADRIAELLLSGLPQEQAGLDLVLATLGESGQAPAPVLARLATDPDTAEHASLAALLLSPGRPVMGALEPALAQAGLDTAGAEALAQAVAGRLSTGSALFPGQLPGLLPTLLPDGTRAELHASAEGLRAFVRRLRPEATAPAELRQLLARRCGPELASELAVKLRHCRLAWTPERIFFLATLLERADLGQDDLPGLLAWAVGFLDLSGLPFEPRRALAARRQALLAQLRQAQFLDETLARGSYETLMSQGLRLAHVHGPDLRAELAQLERAGLLVLGLRPEALDGLLVRGLGQAGDVSELLRLLPGPED